MAEGDCIVLNNFKEQLMLHTINLATDELMIALYEVALASPDGANIAYTAVNEINAVNYVAAGKVIGGKTVTQDDGADQAVLDGTSPTWTALGPHTIVEARLYDNTTGTKYVLLLWTLATDSNGGDYTLDFSPSGIFLIT
jgi:hypothetical protein